VTTTARVPYYRIYEANTKGDQIMEIQYYSIPVLLLCPTTKLNWPQVKPVGRNDNKNRTEGVCINRYTGCQESIIYIIWTPYQTRIYVRKTM
jgi:hypothetical protein